MAYIQLFMVHAVLYFANFPLSMPSSCDETLTGSGSDYTGCQETTVNCLLCQKWSSQSPHTHTTGISVGNHSYCRNPNNGYTIWCYTTDPNIRYAMCTPKSTGSSTTCEPKHSNCNESLIGDGIGYRGCQNRTVKGYPCQNWTSQTPHSHTETASNSPGAGLGNHNYCRNPDGADTIWCYTMDPWIQWDYCAPMMTLHPTTSPTALPTAIPTTHHPTINPTVSPTSNPSNYPSANPTLCMDICQYFFFRVFCMWLFATEHNKLKLNVPHNKKK
eukprot:187763_1